MGSSEGKFLVLVIYLGVEGVCFNFDRHFFLNFLLPFRHFKNKFHQLQLSRENSNESSTSADFSIYCLLHMYVQFENVSIALFPS